MDAFLQIREREIDAAKAYLTDHVAMANVNRIFIADGAGEEVWVAPPPVS